VAERANLDDLRLDPGAREEPGRGKGWWAALAVVLVLAAAAGGLWWWRASAAVAVETAAVREVAGGARGGAVLQASGYVTARRQATVSSKVTGKVVEVTVEEGMKVAAGQVLARLDDSLARRQLALAEAQLASSRDGVTDLEAQLAQAEITLARTQRLRAAGVVAQAQLDIDRTAVDSLTARLAGSRSDVEVAERVVAVQRQGLDDTVIRAPFAGVAISKDAQPGEMVSPVSAGGGFTRTGISTIVDMSSLEIEVDVNEAYINRVRDDQPVEAVLDSYPDWRIPARVITTIPSADRDKATVKVRIAFAELDPRILPDMGVKVSFFEGKSGDEEAAAPRQRLYVPRAAARQQEGQAVVFVVTGDRLERRAVSLGLVEGSDQEVISGLAAGEQVVVAGPDELADGQRVKVKGP
jgi:RND family efflux transporter MFP subunit